MLLYVTKMIFYDSLMCGFYDAGSCSSRIFLLPCVAFSLRSGCIVNRPNASQEFEEYAERRNQVSTAL